jgi:4-hydroxy-tetrahydrodipicolinate synthase
MLGSRQTESELTVIKLDPSFLRGSYTPVITPFQNDGVDYAKFAQLVDRQVREGSHGILVTGTSGEPSSLTIDERAQLVSIAVDVVEHRIPVVAATGCQSLAETTALTTRAEKAGADALLIVTPYYIKPPQAGLVEYFVEMGHRTALPLMIYHIPGRSAVSITAATLARIAERTPNLVGMKHAANDLEFLTEVLTRVGPPFRIFCGLEPLSLPMLCLGAVGLMNAVGNLVPSLVAALCDAVEQNDLQSARQTHFALFELNQAIFFETNPIPLKYMMARIGLIDAPEVRLPLVPVDRDQRRRLDNVLVRACLLPPDRVSEGDE